MPTWLSRTTDLSSILGISTGCSNPFSELRTSTEVVERDLVSRLSRRSHPLITVVCGPAPRQEGGLRVEVRLPAQHGATRRRSGQEGCGRERLELPPPKRLGPKPSASAIPPRPRRSMTAELYRRSVRLRSAQARTRRSSARAARPDRRARMRSRVAAASRRTSPHPDRGCAPSPITCPSSCSSSSPMVTPPPKPAASLRVVSMFTRDLPRHVDRRGLRPARPSRRRPRPARCHRRGSRSGPNGPTRSARAPIGARTARAPRSAVTATGSRCSCRPRRT